jgi:hypothetical protein
MMEWAKRFPRSADLAANHIRKEKLQALNALGIYGTPEDSRMRREIEKNYQEAISD